MLQRVLLPVLQRSLFPKSERDICDLAIAELSLRREWTTISLLITMIVDIAGMNQPIWSEQKQLDF